MESADSRSSELFRLDEEYVNGCSLSYLDTRSRSCSLDNLSPSKHSASSFASRQPRSAAIAIDDDREKKQRLDFGDIALLMG